MKIVFIQFRLKNEHVWSLAASPTFEWARTDFVLRARMLHELRNRRLIA